MKKTALLALSLMLFGIGSIQAAAQENMSAELTAPIQSEDMPKVQLFDTKEEPANSKQGNFPILPDGAESDVLGEDGAPSLAAGRISEGVWTPYEGADYSLTYYFYSDHVTIISCEGNAESANWGDLVIPDEINGSPVTFINYDAFLNCTAFQGNLVLPKYLETISSRAFSGCSGFTSLALPDTMENIGANAFYNCSGFGGSLMLPKGLKSIGDSAFFNCSGLTSLALPDTMENIGANAFYNCSGLSGSLTLPRGLKGIGDFTFSGCGNLTEVIIPDGVTEIGEGAFGECESLISVSVPASLTSIGNAAFTYCNGLTHIYYAGAKEQWDAIAKGDFGNEFINAANIHYNSYYTSDNMPPAFASDVPSKVIVPAGSSPAQSFNQDQHIYSTLCTYSTPDYFVQTNRPWFQTVKSYLYDNGNGLTRVEYIDGNVVIEQYDSSFRFQSGWTITPELPIWGGFFAGEDYNFLIFGQDNPNEVDSVEVIRIVKYDKSWNRLNHASLKGANTTIPFRAGSLRCDEYGGMLYVRTCHEMYKSDDGLNHQANLTFSVRMADMKITDWYYDVSNTSDGYVSHSFNQFIMTDGSGNIVAFDHGDAYPRSAVLLRYLTKAGRNRFVKSYITGPADDSGVWFYSSATELVNMCTFPGETGDNFTGASLGGLAETSSGYVTAYNFSEDRNSRVRSIYISYVPKDDYVQESVATWSDVSAVGTTPVLAPAGLDGGYVLWNNPDNAGTVQYVRYDARGGASQIRSCDSVMLSDCQPIYYQGNIVWYATQNSAPTFYTLNESGVSVYDASGAEQPAPDQQNPEQVRNFVSRMYTVALGREAEEAGLNDWTNRLLSHEIDGSGIANGFIMSDEFKNKGFSDEAYVDILYRTFFDREADAGGRATWTGALSNGNSREFVLAGFVNSVEFDDLCGSFGITRGSMANGERAIGPGVRQFVNRCYVKVLGREGEPAGISDWTGRIARGEQTPESTAKLFFFSEEYANKNTGNEEFVETLYQTFMDRASDPTGKSDWLGRLAGGASREEVLEGFSRSEEFAAILKSFGL